MGCIKLHILNQQYESTELKVSGINKVLTSDLGAGNVRRGMGYSYFGARYYDPELSIWLSVDPKASKYPSWSPYNYCLNNPIKLIDPDGRDVIVTGDAADEATRRLSTRNITVTRDAETGRLSVEGRAKNRSERLLVRAIESDRVTVNLTANNSNVIRTDENGNTVESGYGGAFMGNSLTRNENGKPVSAQTQQFVSMDALNENFEPGNIGKAINHEITESYKGGKISMRRNEEAVPAFRGTNNTIYNRAHNRASRQPFLRNLPDPIPQTPQRTIDVIRNPLIRNPLIRF